MFVCVLVLYISFHDIDLPIETPLQFLYNHVSLLIGSLKYIIDNNFISSGPSSCLLLGVSRKVIHLVFPYPARALLVLSCVMVVVTGPHSHPTTITTHTRVIPIIVQDLLPQPFDAPQSLQPARCVRYIVVSLQRPRYQGCQLKGRNNSININSIKSLSIAVIQLQSNKTTRYLHSHATPTAVPAAVRTHR